MENKLIPAGTKIVIGMSAGMCGTDAMEAYTLEFDILEKELEDFAWQSGLDHASNYGVYPMSDDIYDDDDSEYSDNIEGWWEIYDEKKHAGKCMTGTDQEVYFNKL